MQGVVHMYLSIGRKVQHQEVGMGGGCAPSRAEHKAEDNLWVFYISVVLS